VRRGLDWLARHQSLDGHWGPDSLHARPEAVARWATSAPAEAAITASA